MQRDHGPSHVHYQFIIILLSLVVAPTYVYHKKKGIHHTYKHDSIFVILEIYSSYVKSWVSPVSFPPAGDPEKTSYILLKITFSKKGGSDKSWNRLALLGWTHMCCVANTSCMQFGVFWPFCSSIIYKLFYPRIRTKKSVSSKYKSASLNIALLSPHCSHTL